MGDSERNPDKIFIGNLPFAASKEEIADLFGAVGEVKGINLRADRNTGKLKGFGFVTFSNAESAELAISQFHNYSFQGRPLTVRPADRRGGDSSASAEPPKKKEYITSSSRTAKRDGEKSWTDWSGP